MHKIFKNHITKLVPYDWTETQGRGALHFHAIIFALLRADLLQQIIRDDETRQMVCDIIDSMINATLPKFIKEEEMARRSRKDLKPRVGLQDLPDVKHGVFVDDEKERATAREELMADIRKKACAVNVIVNSHSHRILCFSGNVLHLLAIQSVLQVFVKIRSLLKIKSILLLNDMPKGKEEAVSRGLHEAPSKQNTHCSGQTER